MPTPYHRRAFARTDALALCVLLPTLLVLILITTARTRSNTYQAGSLANLHEFAAVTASYAADNNNALWSLSWSQTQHPVSQFPDLQGPYVDPLGPVADQAVDIMRRRGGPLGAVIPRIQNWIPSVLYSHLVLADYLDTSALLRFAVSPGDRNLRLWSNDPEAYRRGEFPFQPDPPNPANLRNPFASSYRLPPAFWSPDFVTTAHGTIVPSTTHNTFMTVAPFDIGRRRLSEVTYPSHKVLLFDSAQWSGHTVPIFWGYTFARVPMLMADGSAHARATGLANPGFNPQSPLEPFGTTISYTPLANEPPAIGGGSPQFQGRFYWTRNGIKGRDYDGVEVPAVP